jgi:hypothetical protein
LIPAIKEKFRITSLLDNLLDMLACSYYFNLSFNKGVITCSSINFSINIFLQSTLPTLAICDTKLYYGLIKYIKDRYFGLTVFLLLLLYFPSLAKMNAWYRYLSIIIYYILYNNLKNSCDFIGREP